MCYRCGLCQSVVPHGQSRRVHPVYKTGGERVFQTTLSTGSVVRQVSRPARQIAREIPVCGSCQAALSGGVPTAQLYRPRERGRTAPAPAVAKAPRRPSGTARIEAPAVTPRPLPPISLFGD